MANNPAKKLLTPKFLVVGLLLIIIIGGFIMSLSSSQKPAPAPTPTPPPKAQVPFPTTPVDKQIEGQIVVKFKPAYTDAQIAEKLKQYDATVVKKIQGINYTVVKVPAGKENAIIDKLKKDSYVENAMPDYTNHATFVPNDPNFTLQWGLNNTGQTIRNAAGKAKADVNAETAWDVSRGSGVKIAILDSGIDQNHPDLTGKVVASKMFATSALDPDIQDRNGHGTHVAGIIAAITNNGVGVAGTCPECQLMIGKVVNNDISGNATGSTSDIVSGMTWAADNGAKVINLSLRTTTAGSAPLYQQGIDYANSKGAVVVVAAGNDSTNQQVWPAANTGVVSVAATDNNDQMASFSNYGTYVKVAAPGVNIVSTLPTTTNAKNVLNYGYLSGTSMASPFVSGVVGLIWASQYGTSNTAVINRLYATVDKIAGTGTYWTEGRINAGKAVGATVSPSPTIAGGVPSAVCVGGVGAPPCATIGQPYSTGGQPSPTLSLVASQMPSTTQEPGTSTAPSTAPSVTPGGSGSNPCVTTSDIVASLYNSTADNDNEVAHHHKHHHKHHRGGGNGFFSQLFEYLLKIIMKLIELILARPCPNGGTPTPSVTPPTNVTLTPPVTVVPSTAPSVEPTTTITPTPTLYIGVTLVQPATGAAAQNASKR